MIDRIRVVTNIQLQRVLVRVPFFKAKELPPAELRLLAPLFLLVELSLLLLLFLLSWESRSCIDEVEVITCHLLHACCVLVV